MGRRRRRAGHQRHRRNASELPKRAPVSIAGSPAATARDADRAPDRPDLIGALMAIPRKRSKRVVSSSNAKIGVTTDPAHGDRMAAAMTVTDTTGAFLVI